MVDESAREPYERILQESLRGELRVLNAYLPHEAKTLADLLNDKYPHVVCNDGSVHLFKRKELDYLASLIDTSEQKELLLPMIIEISSDDEMNIICRTNVEYKVISKILDMPIVTKPSGITIYKRQLAALRKVLKTTTQYAFSSRVNE